jgi:hypothetical protein
LNLEIEMRISLATALSVMFVLTMHSARAEDAIDQVAPYLGETTIALLRVDLKQVTAPEIAGLVTEADLSGPGSQFVSDIDSFLGAARGAEVSHAYAIYSLGDIGRDVPCLILPTADSAAAKKLAAALLNGMERGNRTVERHAASTADYFELTEAVNSVVFCGSASSRRRIERELAAERSGLRAAIAAVGDSPAAMVFAPTADQRRVVAELLPRLPEELGGLEGATVGGIDWAAGTNTDDGRLRIALHATDAQVAASVVSSLLKVFPQVEGTSDGAGALLTWPIVDGKPTASLRSIVRLFGSLSNQFDAMQNLKQIALAMHNFHDTYDSFPPSASYDGDRPLLSWRVHLLPYLDASGLYGQFHLNEPWDSEHNRKLIERMPDVFKSQDIALNLQGKTTFVLPVGDATAWHGQVGTTIRDIKDGTSNTMMALQATPDHAVIWTKPEDLAVDLDNVGTGIVGPGERFACVFCDGAAYRVLNAIPPASLKAVLTPAGGDAVTWDWRAN